MVTQVNGTDVLGQRIVEVVERIRSKWHQRSATVTGCTTSEKGVTFLLWNSKSENVRIYSSCPRGFIPI